MVSPSNEAFVGITQRVGGGVSHGIAVVPNKYGSFDLVLVDVSSGDGRRVKHVRREERVVREDLPARITILRALVGECDLPVLLHHVLSGENRYWEWELVDPENIEPQIVNGERVTASYVPI